MMLQQPEPSDYVIASGEAHSVREFAELAFEHARMPIRWEGSCEEEVGVVVGSGQVVIRIDPRYYRPVEVPYLCGDSSRAREMLNWQPRVSFEVRRPYGWRCVVVFKGIPGIGSGDGRF